MNLSTAQFTRRVKEVSIRKILEGKVFRNGLVVVKFTVSIVLITCTTIVFQQLNFFSAKNLGFNKENLLVIDHVERIENGATLTDAISHIPGVLNTSFCAALPLQMGNDVFKPENNGDKDFKLNFAAKESLETTCWRPAIRI